jgi:endonuclease/exonuclease/phosphatase family metal-dependent hydrolase
MTIVRVVVFNLKNGGWNEQTRFHDLDKLINTVAQVEAPHLLFLPECTNYHWFRNGPKWEATNRLSELLPGKDVYRPFLSTGTGHRNHAGLFVSADMVKPIDEYRPDDDTRYVMENVLHCRVADEEAWLHAVHWDGSGGPDWFDIQSARHGNLGAKPTLLGGDFNCASHAEKIETAFQWAKRNKRTPWKLRQKARRKNGAWTPQTEPYDDLLDNGFWDAAQIAKNDTPTVNGGSEQVIDRLAVSHQFPGRLVEGSYRVLVPEKGKVYSDHRLVYLELEVAAEHRGCYDLAA